MKTKHNKTRPKGRKPRSERELLKEVINQLKKTHNIMSLFIKKYQNKNQQSKAYLKTYGRAVMIDTVGVDKLADVISENCTVTRHDIVAVLSALGPAMANVLQQSMRVQLPYLGTFKLGVSTIGEQNADDFDVRKNVKGVHVIFHPETKTNAQGKWENHLTRGAKVAELPKNLREVIEAGTGDGDDEGEAGEDRP